MSTVGPIFFTTTFIETFKAGVKQASATGFFFEHNGNLFLVTNKHVIYGKDYSSFASSPEVDKFRITLHTDYDDLSKNESLEIELFAENQKVWLEHIDPRVDVVLVPINLDGVGARLVALNEKQLDFKNLVIEFEKIFVMGYPYGWFDREKNLPIARVGHLSSPFGVPFGDLPVMLGDVEVHPGMSGGPVYMELRDYVTLGDGGKRDYSLGTPRIILVGVLSGKPRWDLVDVGKGQTPAPVSHSLAFIWPSDLIMDILTLKTP